MDLSQELVLGIVDLLVQEDLEIVAEREEERGQDDSEQSEDGGRDGQRKYEYIFARALLYLGLFTGCQRCFITLKSLNSNNTALAKLPKREGRY